MIIFKRRVAYHETDAMGVVHHSNHIKYFEEARVEWLRQKKLTEVHAPVGPYTFAVIDIGIKYMKSARFDDLLEVYVQGRLQGVRIQFRYAIWCERINAWLAQGHTDLVPLDANMKLSRLPREASSVFASDSWDGDVSLDWPAAPSKAKSP